MAGPGFGRCLNLMVDGNKLVVVLDGNDPEVWILEPPFPEFDSACDCVCDSPL